MKRTLGLAIATFMTMSSTTLNANEAGSGPNPFTDCGIGAALFPDTHWAAVSSNVIWDVGTTALTSATASPETCSGSRKKVAEFINHSYDSLIEDTARGDGEYLTAMLDIYGCDATEHSAIATAIRQQVSQQVADESYVVKTQLEKVVDYYDAVNNTVVNQYSKSCSA